MNRIIFPFLFPAVGFVLSVARGFAQMTYSVTDLGTLPGKTISHPGGINNLGDVVGDSPSINGAFQ